MIEHAWLSGRIRAQQPLRQLLRQRRQLWRRTRDDHDAVTYNLICLAIYVGAGSAAMYHLFDYASIAHGLRLSPQIALQISVPTLVLAVPISAALVNRYDQLTSQLIAGKLWMRTIAMLATVTALCAILAISLTDATGALVTLLFLICLTLAFGLVCCTARSLLMLLSILTRDGYLGKLLGRLISHQIGQMQIHQIYNIQFVAYRDQFLRETILAKSLAALSADALEYTRTAIIQRRSPILLGRSLTLARQYLDINVQRLARLNQWLSTRGARLLLPEHMQTTSEDDSGVVRAVIGIAVPMETNLPRWAQHAFRPRRDRFPDPRFGASREFAQQVRTAAVKMAEQGQLESIFSLQKSLSTTLLDLDRRSRAPISGNSRYFNNPFRDFGELPALILSDIVGLVRTADSPLIDQMFSNYHNLVKQAAEEASPDLLAALLRNLPLIESAVNANPVFAEEPHFYAYALANPESLLVRLARRDLPRAIATASVLHRYTIYWNRRTSNAEMRSRLCAAALEILQWLLANGRATAASVAASALARQCVQIGELLTQSRWGYATSLVENDSIDYDYSNSILPVLRASTDRHFLSNMNPELSLFDYTQWDRDLLTGSAHGVGVGDPIPSYFTKGVLLYLCANAYDVVACADVLVECCGKTELLQSIDYLSSLLSNLGVRYNAASDLSRLKTAVSAVS